MKSTVDKVRRHKKLIVTAICLAVGSLHFVTGPDYRGPFPAFVQGYLIDILLPFAMYLLLGVQNLQQIHNNWIRFFLVFGLAAFTETLQYFGVPLFGRTFDPLDYLMFLAGIAGALAFERGVLSRLAGARSA